MNSLAPTPTSPRPDAPEHAAPTAPTHWLDHPKNIKQLWGGFLIVLALTVLAEFFVHLHPTFALEGWFGFHALFGFATCVLMIAGAKLLARVLKRADTFYAKDDDE